MAPALDFDELIGTTSPPPPMQRPGLPALPVPGATTPAQQSPSLDFDALIGTSSQQPAGETGAEQPPPAPTPAPRPIEATDVVPGLNQQTGAPVATPLDLAKQRLDVAQKAATGPYNPKSSLAQERAISAEYDAAQAEYDRQLKAQPVTPSPDEEWYKEDVKPIYNLASGLKAAIPLPNNLIDYISAKAAGTTPEEIQRMMSAGAPTTFKDKVISGLFQGAGMAAGLAAPHAAATRAVQSIKVLANYPKIANIVSRGLGFLFYGQAKMPTDAAISARIKQGGLDTLMGGALGVNALLAETGKAGTALSLPVAGGLGAAMAGSGVTPQDRWVAATTLMVLHTVSMTGKTVPEAKAMTIAEIQKEYGNKYGSAPAVDTAIKTITRIPDSQLEALLAKEKAGPSAQPPLSEKATPAAEPVTAPAKATTMPQEAPVAGKAPTPEPEKVSRPTPAQAAGEGIVRAEGAKIVKTAIRNEDGSITEAPDKEPYLGHDDIQTSVPEENRGFLTDKGEFVGREQAAEIAKSQGVNTGVEPGKLHSEDMRRDASVEELPSPAEAPGPDTQESLVAWQARQNAQKSGKNVLQTLEDERQKNKGATEAKTATPSQEAKVPVVPAVRTPETSAAEKPAPTQKAGATSSKSTPPPAPQPKTQTAAQAEAPTGTKTTAGMQGAGEVKEGRQWKMPPITTETVLKMASGDAKRRGIKLKEAIRDKADENHVDYGERESAESIARKIAAVVGKQEGAKVEKPVEPEPPKTPEPPAPVKVEATAERKTVTVFRVTKGGGYTWTKGDQRGKSYMGYDQAKKAARKANPDAEIVQGPIGGPKPEQIEPKPKGRKRLMSDEARAANPVAAYVEDNGGIRPYKRLVNQATGKEETKPYMKEHYEQVPLRHRAAKGGKSGQTPDTMHSMLVAEGIMPEGSTVEDMLVVLKGGKQRVSESAYYRDQAEAEADWIANRSEGVTAEKLAVGDKMKIKGETFTVTAETDTALRLKDGQEYWLPYDGNETLTIDKGSLKKAEKAPASAELFTAEETPFNLAGETQKAPAAKPVPSAETVQTEMFQIQKVVENKDPVKSANAAEEIYGSPTEAIKRINKQLKVIDSDPAQKRAFVKEQRQRLKEVLALLEQRAYSRPAGSVGAALGVPAPEQRGKTGGENERERTTPRSESTTVPQGPGSGIGPGGAAAATTPAADDQEFHPNFGISEKELKDTREQLGLPPAEKGPVQSDEAVNQEAIRREKATPGATDDLIRDITYAKEAKPLDTVQVAMLRNGYVTRIHEYNEAASETVIAAQSGDPQRIAEANARCDEAFARLNEVIDASSIGEGSVKSEAGRALRQFGVMVDGDFNLMRMQAGLKAAKGDVDLSREELQEIKRLDSAKTRIRNRIDELEKKIAAKDASKPAKATPLQDDAAMKSLRTQMDEVKDRYNTMVRHATRDRLKAEFKARQESGSLAGSKPTFSPEESMAIWRHAKGEYMDNDVTGPLEVADKTAKDLGLKRSWVLRALAEKQREDTRTDAEWLAQNYRQELKKTARMAVSEMDKPEWQKLVKKIAIDTPRGIAVFGHGTVWPGTHAPGFALRPITGWSAWWPGIAKSFSIFWGTNAEPKYKAAVETITGHEHYAKQLRSGLDVDPSTVHDDMQNYAQISTRWGKPSKAVTERSNKAWIGLKLARQMIWEKEWSRLSPAEQTPLRAQLLSEWVNHATGAANTKRIPTTIKQAMFAPSLEAARWARIVGDPVATLKGLGKNALPEERAMAWFRIRRSAETVATYATLLGSSAGLSYALGHKDKINFTHPLKTDWLLPKRNGHTLNLTGGTLAPIRLLAEVLQVADPRFSDNRGTGNLHIIGQDMIDYARGKLTPGAGIVVDLLTRENYARRPLPFSLKPGTASKPKETWKEWFAEHGPIPASGVVREIYNSMRDQGISEPDARSIIYGLAVMPIEAVGVRVGDTGPDSQMSPETRTIINKLQNKTGRVFSPLERAEIALEASRRAAARASKTKTATGAQPDTLDKYLHPKQKKSRFE